MADMKRNEPGMDDDQAQHDRNNWDTTVEMLTKGRNAHFCDGGSPEVGLQYDYDGLGEEYSPVTYGPEPEYPAGTAKGGPAAPSTQMEEKSSGGGMRASAPQNYTKAPKAGD